MVPVKDWAVDMHGDGRHRDHSEAMSGALGTVVLTAIMPGEGGIVEATGPAATRTPSLFHYTTKEGMEAILTSG